MKCFRCEEGLKGENGEGYDFVVVTSETNSGLRLCPWVEWTLVLNEKQERMKGFFFCIENGRRMSSNNSKKLSAFDWGYSGCARRIWIISFIQERIYFGGTE